MKINKQIFLCSSDDRYTHVGANKRVELCVDAFKHIERKNDNVKIGFIMPVDVNANIDIPVFNLIKRNSSCVVKGDRNLPFVNDLLNHACDLAEDIFVFCNSDIIVSQKLIDLINNTDVEAFGITRTEILPITSIYEQATVVRNEPAGFDCWVVSKKWWILHKDLFHDMLIGQPEFDVLYTLLMLMNSKNIYLSNNNYIFHVMHERQWTTDGTDPYSAFNCNQLNYYPEFKSLWGELCNSTFWTRADKGSFLKVSEVEATTIQYIKQLRNGCLKSRLNNIQ